MQPTLRKKIPQTPRKKFLSNVEKFISEVKMKKTFPTRDTAYPFL